MSTSIAARLARRLDRELSWRKKELIGVYLDLPKEDDGLNNAQLKCRQAILLLYAHWEGFVKKFFRYYLEELAASNPDPRLLNNQLIGLAMRSSIREAAAERTSGKLGKCLRDVLDGAVTLPRIRTENAIRTQSNLSVRVLREILETVGFDRKRYAAYEASTIKLLLEHRNAIAHGEGTPIPLDVYKRYHHDVIDIISDMREHLEDQMAARAYLN